VLGFRRRGDRKTKEPFNEGRKKEKKEKIKRKEAKQD
jgi:hypothetical protein